MISFREVLLEAKNNYADRAKVERILAVCLAAEEVLSRCPDEASLMQAGFQEDTLEFLRGYKDGGWSHERAKEFLSLLH